MAEFTDREHYIPLRKSDLIEQLCKDSKLNTQERDSFRQFGRLVGAIWHFEYLEMLEKLKDTYAPFDPDSVTQQIKPLSPDMRPQGMDRFFDQFVKLMEKANFKRLSRKDIDAAIEGGASDWGVNMQVDFDVFERLEIFARGDSQVVRIKKHPIFFWRNEQKKVDTFQRLVLLVKLRKHKRLPPTIDTDDVFIKMFKDIPKVDLEMVLPGTSLQMPLMQKWKMGGSLIGTLAYAVWKVGIELYRGILTLLGMTFTAATAALSVLWGPFLLLGGYGYKQYYTYHVTKQQYSKMLAESLYFQNLDNNQGVVTQLIDEAEEQECRETILAYYYLWKYAPSEGWSSDQIDDYIEMELEGKYGLKVDFEVSDALAKLETLNIVTRSGEKYRAVGIDKALEKLDYRWDNYFTYNKG